MGSKTPLVLTSTVSVPTGAFSIQDVRKIRSNIKNLFFINHYPASCKSTLNTVGIYTQRTSWHPL